MKTTVDLDDDIVKQAELLAAKTDRTLSGVVEEALRAHLHQPPKHIAATREWKKLRSSTGPPLPKDFPWHNNAAMLDFEEAHADDGSS